MHTQELRCLLPHPRHRLVQPAAPCRHLCGCARQLKQPSASKSSKLRPSQRFIITWKHAQTCLPLDYLPCGSAELPAGALRVHGQPRPGLSWCLPSAARPFRLSCTVCAELCCERAGLADGQAILELGCGWGSLCLYAAAKFPGARVTAVSNSRTQREFIQHCARERGLTNLARPWLRPIRLVPGRPEGLCGSARVITYTSSGAAYYVA